MELKLVIFLAFTSVTLVANTMLIWFAYKGFAGIVTRVAETVTEFEKSKDTVEAVNSIRMAAENARKATDITREKLTGFGPVLEQASENWALKLAQFDAKFEIIEQQVSVTGGKVRDAVAKPAYTIAAVASGIHTVLDYVSPDADET